MKKRNWLEKIREKSDQQKKVISFCVSFCVTAIIFSVWLINFMSTDSATIAEKVNTRNTASPITALKEFVKGAFDFGSFGKETYNND